MDDNVTVESIDLINCGTGPAKIKSFTVYIDGRPIHKTKKEDNIWDCTFQALGCPSLPSSWFEYDKNEVVAINEKETIVGIDKEDEKDTTTVTAWKKVIPRITINIVYTSIYDEEFTEKYPNND